MGIKRLIVGTAGHVDHGKTSLIKSLTGIDTDRLKEEKQRGITVDLGFAYIEDGDYSFSFVDVPGHENYLKNMAAGAIGFEACILVIDINEGIKEQTVEHVNIINFLGVEYLIVVFTKVDKFFGDIEEFKREVEHFFEKYDFKYIKYISFSIYDTSGKELLLNILKDIANRFVRVEKHHFFYLNVDRSFILKGFGTVVTGSVLSGEVTAADTVRVLPKDRKLKIKGLTVHGRKVEKVYAGDRAAINIADVEVDYISRGDVLINDEDIDNYEEGFCVIKKFEGYKDFRFKNGGIYNILIGTSFKMVRLRILKEEDGYVLANMKLLESRYPLISGDKFLIRLSNPKITIAGGEIIIPGTLNITKKDILEILQQFITNGAIAAFEKYMEIFKIIKSNKLYQMFKISNYKDLTSVIISDDYLINKRFIDDSVRKYKDLIYEKGYLTLKELDNKNHFINKMLLDKLLDLLGRDHFVLSGNEIKKSDDSFLDLANKVSELLKSDISRSNVKLLAEELKLEEDVVKNVLKYLLNRGDIKKIDKDGNYIHIEILKDFVKKAFEYAKKNGYIDITNIRDVITAPRRILIPLLEILDKTGLFKNIDNKRYIK